MLAFTVLTSVILCFAGKRKANVSSTFVHGTFAGSHCVQSLCESVLKSVELQRGQLSLISDFM